MKCIRCGNESYGNSRICHSCLNNWLTMRTIAYNALENKLGKFSAQNQVEFKKQMKKLESIWRKDKEKFNSEIERLAA